ncbi:hypothetical protein J1N35_024324 [Gossypium stocksii]|uniref:Cytochrome b5 heme-binding domain-containing protein n=1 Tax=Gossypium stocksii TaxID=47602 RepID=A0A9D3V4J0_9ROSI|nr:hypothetical protein J1N35_024324 [Gossypium stocksii]
MFFKVYNVTQFLEDHSGGVEVLLAASEKDATDDFEDVGLSDDAREQIQKYYIGEVDATTIPTRRTYKAQTSTVATHQEDPGTPLDLRLRIRFTVLGEEGKNRNLDNFPIMEPACSYLCLLKLLLLLSCS